MIENDCMTEKIIKKSFNIFDGILPFTEKPCKNYFGKKEEREKGQIEASELFSFFTANIIKEDVIFIR